MTILCLSAEALRAALPMRVAVRLMGQAFAAASSGRATVPLRTSLSIPEHDGTTLVMPCYLPDYGLGAKIASVFPRNRKRFKPAIQGLIVLLDPESGEPVALVEGSALTAWRTGAASGAATDLLARQDVASAAVLGAGPQARTQIVALDAVRAFETIRVYARTPDRVRALVEEVTPRVSAALVAVESASQAVRDAEVICTATNSSQPVLDGRMLERGTHINAIGSFQLDMQEVDATTIKRAKIFVDSRAAALAEAGELVAAKAAGLTSDEQWTELGEVVTGAAPGRESPEEITMFKSVGLAVQDIVAASEAVRRARDLDLGQEIEW